MDARLCCVASNWAVDWPPFDHSSRDKGKRLPLVEHRVQERRRSVRHNCAAKYRDERSVRGDQWCDLWHSSRQNRVSKTSPLGHCPILRPPQSSVGLVDMHILFAPAIAPSSFLDESVRPRGPNGHCHCQTRRLLIAGCLDLSSFGRSLNVAFVAFRKVGR